MACEVYGGSYLSCIPPDDVAKYTATFGRPCPRVILDPDNAVPFEILARYPGDPDPLYDAWLRSYLAVLDLSKPVEHVLLERAMMARSSPEVVAFRSERLAAATAPADKRR